MINRTTDSSATKLINILLSSAWLLLLLLVNQSLQQPIIFISLIYGIYWGFFISVIATISAMVNDFMLNGDDVVLNIIFTFVKFVCMSVFLILGQKIHKHLQK